MTSNSKPLHSLFYALSFLLSVWLLVSHFDIIKTLHRVNSSKTILIENVSAAGRSNIFLGYINQSYQPLPLNSFASNTWKLTKLSGPNIETLTSSRQGDKLRIEIPIAGSTQFVFITSPDSGRVRLTDLETNHASEVDLQASQNYTATLSTVSGTKRAWDLFLASLVVLVTAPTIVAMILRGWRSGWRIWDDTNASPLAYTVIALTTVLNNLFMTYRLFFFGDSKGYWEMAPSFARDSIFSFQNLELSLSFRGYVLPLIAFVAQELGVFFKLQSVLVYVLLMALIYSLFFIFIVPRTIRWLTGKPSRPYQLLLVFALTGFFWLGWFTWLLSDLLAVCGLLTGLTFLLQGIEKRNTFFIILSGVFTGLAINLRPSYEFGLFISFGFIYSIWHGPTTRVLSRSAQVRRFLQIGILYLLGVVLISLPQAEINWRQFQKLSIFPFASNNPNSYGLETHGTFLEYSLAYGRLRTQGWPYPYPNRIGISALYRYFGIDPIALEDYNAAGEMLKQHGGMNVPLYLDLVRRFPLEFAVDYFLKIFTGLNNQSFEPYPVNWLAGPPIALFTFFNYCVLFLAALILYRRLSDLVHAGQGNLPVALWYIILALPALFYVPLFVEWRYFLPIYLSMYVLLATTERSVYARIFSNKLLPLLFVLFILVCFSLSALVTPAYID